MSAYAAIRDQITTILESVSGIGKVHARERRTTRAETMLALYSANGVLNGWVIRRIRTVVDRLPGEETRTYTFRLSGVYAVSDADVAADSSEQKFQELIERIGDTFRSNVTLNGTSPLSGPLTVATVEERMFAGVLVHYCELLLPVDEQLAI